MRKLREGHSQINDGQSSGVPFRFLIHKPVPVSSPSPFTDPASLGHLTAAYHALFSCTEYDLTGARGIDHLR